MPYTKEVANNVFLIDDELYNIPRTGSIYLLTEERKALIDTGPATSSMTVLQGIQQIGFSPKGIDYIILTHIHLDHAGGSGTLVNEMPGAKLLAHPRAIKHLLNPAILVNSAIQAQGNEVRSRNGEMLPIPEQRLESVQDGDVIRLGEGQALRIMECPGHAPHEICIYESRNKGVFVGDAVGHVVEGTDVIIPITPPPSFDLEAYLKTLGRLRQLKASLIYFAHSGVSSQVSEKLKAAEEELQTRNEIIAGAIQENRPDIAAQKVMDHVQDSLEVIKEHMPAAYDYWLNVDVKMSADEHVRYYLKKHPKAGRS